MKLNIDKMEKFAHEWINHGCDPTKWEAIMAGSGYAKNRPMFSKILQKEKMQGRIYELQQEARSSKVMTLRDRLELLTSLAKDENQPTTQRIAAMNAIHRQSGDDVAQVTLSKDDEAKATNVVRMVDVKLPAPKSNDLADYVDDVDDADDANDADEEGEIDEELLSELDKLDSLEDDGLINDEDEDND